MAAPGEQVRVAVAGIGGRGAWAAKQLAQDPNYDLVALCDANAGKLDFYKRKEELGDVLSFTSIAACLREAPLDAVVVTTHDGAHADVAIPALEAGKFVFVEKPLDVTEEQCRAIVEADRAAGGKTFVGLNLRFAPVYATAKRLIDEGAVGEILTIQADEFYDGGRTYFRRWNRLRALGGGLWITKACHDFDLLYWLSGREPLSVYAIDALTYYRPRDDAPLHCAECERRDNCPDGFYAIKKRGNIQEKLLSEVAAEHGAPRPDLCLFNSDKDTFDHGIATVALEGGVLATYTCNVVTGFSDRRLRVSGTKGTLDGALAAETILLRRREPSAEEEIPLDLQGGGHGGGDLLLFDEFLEFIKGRREPRARPADAIVSVLMGLAATRSAAERRPVQMSEFHT
jgi:predicted dehydrogenase